MRNLVDKTYLAGRRLLIAVAATVGVALAVIWGGAVVGFIEHPAEVTGDVATWVVEMGGWRQFATVVLGGFLGFFIFGEVDPTGGGGGEAEPADGNGRR